MQDQTGIPPPKSGHGVKSVEEVAYQGLVVNCQPVLRFNLQKKTCLAQKVDLHQAIASKKLPTPLLIAIQCCKVF